jgi:hypothetical protein
VKDDLHTVSVYAGVHLLLCPEILDGTRTDCDALVHIVCHFHSDFVIALTDTSSHFHLGQ